MGEGDVMAEPTFVEQIIEECAKTADRVRDHAQSRICNDGSYLDYRQKIRKETAEAIAAQIRAIRWPGEAPEDDIIRTYDPTIPYVDPRRRS